VAANDAAITGWEGEAMLKKKVPVAAAYRLLTPGWVVLVASEKEGRYNVMTASWQMPVSINPPLVAVAVVKKHLTAEYILAGKSFTLNVPGRELLPKVHYCGSVSGRGVDKFATAGLTPVQGDQVAAPLVAECLAGVECRLWKVYDGGDHYLFVGEIVAAVAATDYFENHWLLGGDELNRPVNHLGGPLYAVPSKVLRVTREDSGFTVAEET